MRSVDLMQQDFNLALGLLVQKPLPAKISWPIADAVDEVQKAQKRYQEKKKEIFLRHGATELQQGVIGFPDNSMPDDCKKELADLDSLEVEIHIEPFDLPEKTAAGQEIAWEPIVRIALKNIGWLRNVKP